jgi:cysteinyl-tRNA synthetase
VLRAGFAGDRPEGVATGVTGHGDDGDRTTEFELVDRASVPAAPLTPESRALHDRFVAAIDDDLDMPVALALAREILRADVSEDERRWLILDADLVLGLDLDRVWAESEQEAEVVPADVAALIEARTAARSARDWARADALRSGIEALGWDVIDEAGGPVLTRRGPSSGG